MPVQQVSLLLSVASRLTSLDAPLGPERDAPTLADLLPDTHVPNSRSEVAAHAELDTVRNLLFGLPDQLQEVLCRCYGLRGYNVENLSEAAAAMEVSPEAIRRFQDRAIRMVRVLNARKDKYAETAQ